MNAFKSTEFATESLSYAIIWSKLKEAAQSLENNSKPIEYNITLIESFNNQYGLLLETGITVAEIKQDSIFKDVLLVDDLIKYIDDKGIFTKADFFENYYPGADIEIVRNGETIRITTDEQS